MLKTKKQNVEKQTIKEYWEKSAPQTWYSDKEPLSIEWFNEIEYKRYNLYLECFNEMFEYEYHYKEKVLEIGCGVGTDLVRFAKNGALCSAIDLTEFAIKTTKKHFELKNLKYEELLVADAEDLPFNDNTFDLVISFGVIHHTPDIQKCVNEIYRVLKPEGSAIILIYSRGWKHYFKRVFIHGILLGGLIRYGYSRLINRQTEVHGNSPLTYVHKKREVKKLFNIFGELKIYRKRMGEYFDYAPWRSRKLPRWLTNIVYLFTLEKVFGELFIIKAIKSDRKQRISLFKSFLKP